MNIEIASPGHSRRPEETAARNVPSAAAGVRRRGTFSICVFALLALLAPTGVRAEDDADRAERLESLIEGLNAGSADRSRTAELIHNEARGSYSSQILQALQDALARSNTLILQGAIEAMAMIGDPDVIDPVEAFVATTPFLEARTLALRLLPAFTLGGNERARLNFIRYASGRQRIPGPAVLAPLRRPPLTRRGRLNGDQQRLQSRITLILAVQFDPVDAALRYFGDATRNSAARAAVLHFVGGSLGNDPARWARLWAEQGSEAKHLRPEEIGEIRMAALQALSDMGAEGLPEVLEGFGRLLEMEDGILRQAVFETLATMCRIGFQAFPPLSAMIFSDQDAVEANNWRERRFDTLSNLAVFAVANAAGRLPGIGDSSGFAAAADCLGAALSFPPGFPDSDGSLAEARTRGLAVLETLLMAPDIPLPKRVSTAAALGEAGARRSVVAIRGILDSPYTRADSGPDGMRMAEAAVDALRTIASGAQEGRDAARELLLELLRDPREFPSARPDVPPTRIAHIALWRLQRMARSANVTFDPEAWRERLGW